MATAQAQVLTAQAQLINAGLVRIQYENAIAMLIGRPPDELSDRAASLGGGIPRMPVSCRRRCSSGDPISRRRTHHAAGECADRCRRGGLFPGHFAVQHDPVFRSYSAAVQRRDRSRRSAPTHANPLQRRVDFGAQVDAARALYWESVANYRQTVLTAFQQVENELAAIHIYAQQLAVQQRAVAAERTAVNVYLNQFQPGVVAFTTVVTAEVQLLADEEAELTTRQNLYLASVALIEALGGGWDTTLIPTPVQLQKGFTFFPQLESARA